MINFSRRQLALYAVDALLNDESPSKLSKQLAAALFTAHKQKDADLLLNDIASELESRGVTATAKITTAHELSQSLRKVLEMEIKETAKVNTVVLSENVDKDVIGGFRIETANHTWDTTIARRLTDIKGGI